MAASRPRNLMGFYGLLERLIYYSLWFVTLPMRIHQAEYILAVGLPSVRSSTMPFSTAADRCVTNSWVRQKICFYVPCSVVSLNTCLFGIRRFGKRLQHSPINGLLLPSQESISVVYICAFSKTELRCLSPRAYR
jgi:hypothetical protein